MFNTKSKYYEPILANLRRILGAAEATEAEIDQALTELQSFEDVETKAAENVDAALLAEKSILEAKIVKLEAELGLATTRMEEAVTSAAAADAKTVQLTTELAKAEKDRNTVAAELATLKAGSHKEDKPAEEGIQTPAVQAVQSLGGFVVETPELATRILGKKAKGN